MCLCMCVCVCLYVYVQLLRDISRFFRMYNICTITDVSGVHEGEADGEGSGEGAICPQKQRESNVKLSCLNRVIRARMLYIHA